jgi:hypothetical protein
LLLPPDPVLNSSKCISKLTASKAPKVIYGPKCLHQQTRIWPSLLAIIAYREISILARREERLKPSKKHPHISPALHQDAIMVISYFITPMSTGSIPIV